MEQMKISFARCEKFIYEALEDYGYGYKEEFKITPIINEEQNTFYFEVKKTERYRGEITTRIIELQPKDYVELLRHSLNKNGYDIDKIYLRIKKGEIEIKLNIGIVNKEFTYGKRKKRR